MDMIVYLKRWETPEAAINVCRVACAAALTLAGGAACRVRRVDLRFSQRRLEMKERDVLFVSRCERETAASAYITHDLVHESIKRIISASTTFCFIDYGFSVEHFVAFYFDAAYALNNFLNLYKNTSNEIISWIHLWLENHTNIFRKCIGIHFLTVNSL
jgi:hypothetical protein